MSRVAADERRSGNEESRGAPVSGAERVLPEVSPTPAKPRNRNHRQTHTQSEARTHKDEQAQIVLLARLKTVEFK